MLSDEEIVRRLRIIRHSPQADRYARRATSMNGIAQAADVAREYLYSIVNGEPFGQRTRLALSRILTCEDMTRVRTDSLSPELGGGHTVSARNRADRAD
jgi:hypothetical protein